MCGTFDEDVNGHPNTSAFSAPTKDARGGRLVSLISLLADTALRINEALNLRRKDIDFENCLMDITGKGGKFRRIPISLECRKVLYRYLQSHNYDLVFCSRDGCKLRYPNIRYDFKLLCQRLGINGFDGSFHSLRRYWASLAARRNVNPFLIQKNLGHASIAMTQKYIRLECGDLQSAHVSALQQRGGFVR
jgi:integrase/recombinase XerD